MRLLVVEDEAKTADFLAKGLKESGFAVTDRQVENSGNLWS